VKAEPNKQGKTALQEVALPISFDLLKLSNIFKATSTEWQLQVEDTS